MGRDWTLTEVILVVLGALLLLWQPVFFLNDELAQGVLHHTLADGRLVTEEVPAGYDRIEREVYTHGSLAEAEAQPRVLPGSMMEAVLGLPVRGVLLVLSLPLGLDAALGLVCAAGVGTATLLVARRRWDEPRARLAALAVAAVLLAGSLLRGDATPADPFLDVASQQLVGLGWTALAVGLWWHMLRPQGERAAWAGAALLLVATPMLFWAFQTKYHALSLALETAAVWSYRDGHRTPPLRTFAAAALVGLAVWNHLFTGLLLGAALLLAALPVLRRGGAVLRVAAGLGGLAVGLLPVILQSWAEPDVPAAAVASASVGAYEGVAATGFWDGPADALEMLWQTYVWADWFDLGEALSVLSWAPWAVLAVVTLARRDLRAGVPLWPVAVTYLLVPPLLVGLRATDQGAGYDVRLLVPLWPWLVLLAWPALLDLLRRRPARWWAEQAAAAATLGMAVLLTVNLLWHKTTGVYVVQKGYPFEGTWIHRHAGIALAVALAALLELARRDVRWILWRDRVLAWGLAASLSLAPWLRLTGMSGFPETTAPFVAWPIDLLSRGLRWVGYST